MMHAPFDEAPARLHARYLAHLITKTGFLDFDSNKTIPTIDLFKPQSGVMIGVLLGIDEKGDEVLLKAVSGQNRNLSHYVPHVISEEEYQRYLNEYDPLIKDPANTALEQSEYSSQALKHYYSLYRFPTLSGGSTTLTECFEGKPIPTGSGDCAAIKLLSYALNHQITPTSMTEFFYGSGTRTHLGFYGPCEERCRPILKSMLGVDIVYRDRHILVVNKQPHLRSVPGTTENDSIETRVRTLIPSAPLQCATHRLDMDTSGLMVIALSKEALRGMQTLFREYRVTRGYEALLEGILKEKEVVITLPLRADITNRPHQIVDRTNGKEAKTLVRRIRVEEHLGGHLTRVEFTPVTGRTHQLRIHSKEGLGLPIFGDRLYGSGMKSRLFLHAKSLVFPHPITKEELHFTIGVPF